VFEYNVWYNEWDIDRYFGDPPNGNGIFEDSDMDAFYYQKMNWSLMTSGTEEEKASQASAMYYSYDADYDYPGSPPGPGYHAARGKGSCGNDWIMYESKVGAWETIEHVWDQLDESIYGEKPDRFYKYIFIEP
jgi:hypothetical protein